MSGVEVEWQDFYANERRRKAVLRHYRFKRKRYWPQSPATRSQTPSVPVETASVQVAVGTTEESAAPSGQPGEVLPSAPRKDRLLGSVRSLLAELSGYDLADVDPSRDLMELGFDSLLLTQASQWLTRDFKCLIR